MMSETKTIPVVRATKENIKEYGVLITDEIDNVKDIPFYRGKVIEGQNFDFHYHEKAVIRTARLLPRTDYSVNWLERHMRLSQLFVGLGDEPFCLILGKPTPNPQKGDLPDMSTVKCFLFSAGTGIIIHLGTWHDFPIPVINPVTVLTMNSSEVVKALQEMKEPGEMVCDRIHTFFTIQYLSQLFFDYRIKEMFTKFIWRNTLDASIELKECLISLNNKHIILLSFLLLQHGIM